MTNSEYFELYELIKKEKIEDRAEKRRFRKLIDEYLQNRGKVRCKEIEEYLDSVESEYYNREGRLAKPCRIREYYYRCKITEGYKLF